MISLYIPGSTWLHRVPAGAKLLVMALISPLIFMVTQWPWLAVGLLLPLAIAASLGSAGLARLAGLRVLLPVVLGIGVIQAWMMSLDAALLSITRIMLMVMLADLITVTTPMQDMMQAMRPLLRPLEFLGLSPKKLSLAMALMIRFIPVLAAQWSAQREAWQARSHRNPKLRLVAPFVSLAMRRTDRVAESVAARSHAMSSGSVALSHSHIADRSR